MVKYGGTFYGPHTTLTMQYQVHWSKSKGKEKKLKNK